MPLRRPLPGVVVGCEERVRADGDACAGGGAVHWMRVRGRLVVDLSTCVPEYGGMASRDCADREAADGIRGAWVGWRGGGLATRYVQRWGCRCSGEVVGRPTGWRG